MKARKKLVALLILFLLSISTTAQAQERRVIPVSVVGKDGKIVEGLTAANFRGKFRGKEVTIISANLPPKPLRIAILLDTSKSMKEGMGFFFCQDIGSRRGSRCGKGVGP